MDVASFADMRDEFMRRVARIVWCTVATVDRKGRPRTRILHPIWEGSTGWIATGRRSLKARHLEKNPYISLTYWDPQHELISAECRAEWEDRADEKRRVWDLFKSTPPPLGYDPAIIWKGPEDPSFGLLKLSPWRIELATPAPAGLEQLVWRA